jgi:hypothetical protein
MQKTQVIRMTRQSDISSREIYLIVNQMQYNVESWPFVSLCSINN